MTAHSPLRLRAPRLWVSVVIFVVITAVAFPLSEFKLTWFNMYLSVAWALFALVTVTDLRGMLHARRVIAASSTLNRELDEATTLVALVVTKGDRRNLPSIERVVLSLLESLPAGFGRWMVAIVTEEAPISDGLNELEEFVDSLDPRLRGRVCLFVRPHDWETPNSTRFKARANQYALARLGELGLLNPNVWNLHLDDDTAIARDTAHAAADFIHQQQELHTDHGHEHDHKDHPKKSQDEKPPNRRA